MDIIEFDNPVRFTPNMLCVPSEYCDATFARMDFSTRVPLKEFIVGYLKSFSITSDAGVFDSLLLFPGDLSFRILVALYREIGSRITVDNYRFINWAVYVSELRGSGYHADMKLHEDMEDIKFVFVFDLNFLHKESVTYFCELIDLCYTNRIKMFIATRDLAILDKLPDSYRALSERKLWAVKIND